MARASPFDDVIPRAQVSAPGALAVQPNDGDLDRNGHLDILRALDLAARWSARPRE